MKIIFATNNNHKALELQSVVPGTIEIITLKHAGIDIDIPEPYDTLEENAVEKAKTIYTLTGLACFSEDTGLEVKALNGAPGVKSARYAGEEKSFDNNIDKLLSELKDKKDRSAQFRTVVCLIIDGQQYLFEGICKGRIIEERRGEGGFGYDPVFVPEGADKTFAQMSLQEKNMYSHRRLAADKLVVFLNNLNIN